MQIARRLLDWLGGVDARVPGDWLALEFGPPDDDTRPMYVANTSNDGFEVFIGYRHQWLFHTQAESARRLAWWILWDWWIVATWCGLKRWVYSWALSRTLGEAERRMKTQRQTKEER